ncbi:desmoglein-2-like [Mugil cephalus]|uniref:desmoglein-2-like n=1 Tax=Mugil cephalus TaxID=48193 RepID=UPI001FB582EE|nr:desmoglein-2-like [Mugil cephalus]
MARVFLAEVGLILLVLALMVSADDKEERQKTLRRQRREWILPPSKLMENTDYTHLEFIAKIRSDKDQNAKVEYYLSGPGADKPPFNLFVVDHNTGFVRITDTLDREKYPSYNLTGIAKYTDGTTAEDDIPLTVTVLDQNDNAPYFELQTGNISEASKEGTFVMQLKGKDDDQSGTANAEISYSIISQEPEGTGHMFTLEEKTGKLFVKEPTLDRETYDFYKLVIKGTDMGGAADGLTGTGTVEIKVLDINDNIPTLEKSEYNGSVDENVADVVVMRITALDKDLEHTDNWLTVFKIAKGNEDNLFSIETDKETNEGILKLVKPVDFEEIQNLELGLLIENVAPFVMGGAIQMDVDVQVGEGGPLATGPGVGAGAGVDATVDLGVDIGIDASLNVDMDLDADLEGGLDAGLDAGLNPNAGVGLGHGIKPSAGAGMDTGVKPGIQAGPGTKLKPDAPMKSYPIKIAVNNVPEGPAFVPNTKNVPVSEDPNEVTQDGKITVFAAIDPDTGKTAEDVSYAKAYDPDNWFTIDEETAEIKLNKVPDRESPFLVNGTYIAKILAISKDLPSKTATGTIAIQVTDSNDHCPTLTKTHSSLCSDEKTIHVTGFDEDASPNAAPFTFRVLPDGTQGSWVAESINETSAAFHSRETLWPGSYELQIEVLDAQGLSCPVNEVLIIDVCTCVGTEDCRLRAARVGTTSSELSAPAIGLLSMTLCLLLFVPLLLLFCQYGGADTIFPDKFNDLPFDTKEHLISYHTECRGEDKELPLQSVPIMPTMQRKVENAPAPNFNTIVSAPAETHQSFYNESVQRFQETCQTSEVKKYCSFSRLSYHHGKDNATFSGKPLVIHHMASLYEDVAFPDVFLNDYYSQKSVCAVPVKDGLLEHDFEGQGSSAGSVGCCSLLDSDDDLYYLNDLGPKFKTLAEICSQSTQRPKTSLTHKAGSVIETTVDIVEPFIKPSEAKHVGVKTEEVLTSINTFKSSVSTESTTIPSITLPCSKVANISLSSNTSYAAQVPYPAQKTVLRQQPLYYTSSAVVPSMHYIVQPQYNTLMLTDGSHGSNFPGLYVVGSQSPSGLVISGPQSFPSGLLLQDTESPKHPKYPASPTSSVYPTVLLCDSSVVSHSSASVEGWEIMRPNTDGNYMLLKNKSIPEEAKGLDTGSSQGILPGGVVLVKGAAPPQGVYDLAAQGSVDCSLPSHVITKRGEVAVLHRQLGQRWVGQSGQMGLEPVTDLIVGIGKPRRGIGCVMAEKPKGRQPGTGTAGIEQLSMNQFHRSHQLEERTEANSPNEDRAFKKLDYNGSVVKLQDNTIKEKHSENLVTYKDDVIEVAFDDSDNAQEYSIQTEKFTIINLEGEVVISLQRPDILLQISGNQCDTVVQKPRDIKDKIVPSWLAKTSNKTMHRIYISDNKTH